MSRFPTPLMMVPESQRTNSESLTAGTSSLSDFWEAVKFPEIDWNEDGEFSLAVKSKFKVDGIHDTVGLCLHFLHADSRSRCFPRYHLPRCLFRAIFPGLDFPAAHEPGDPTHPAAEHSVVQLAWSQSGWTPDRAMGGTELTVEGLWRRLGKELDAINLRVNAYEVADLDSRPLIVWVHHDCDQVAVQWYYDRNKVQRAAWFVFVSEWRKARYVDRFGVPPEKCFVLRNASDISHSNRQWNRNRGKTKGTAAFFSCADSPGWTLCVMCRRHPPFPR